MRNLYPMEGLWRFREAGQDPGVLEPRYDDSGWTAADWNTLWNQTLQNPGKTVICRYTFAALPGRSRSWRLTLQGFPRTWQVYLNGTEVGDSGDAFVSDYDVTRWLLTDNALVITAAPLAETRPSEPAPMPRLDLVQSGPYSILGARFDALDFADGNARIRSTVVVRSPDDAPVMLEMALAGPESSGPGHQCQKLFFVVVGENDLIQRFALPQARLWSARGRGEPFLYRACIRLRDGDGILSDEMDVPFGLRSIEWKGDAPQVNGEPFSCAFGLEPDFPPGTGDPERLPASGSDHLIRRLPWGSEPGIYDAADSAGMLIVQDVPVCDGPGHDDLSPSEVRTREALRLAGSHPSVGFWNAVRSPHPLSGGLLKKALVRHRDLKSVRLLAKALRDADDTRPVLMEGRLFSDKD